LNSDLYESEYFCISKSGKWSLKDEFPTGKQVQESDPSAPVFPENIIKVLQQCDVIFPVLHGTFGEDGTIQGLFEMLHTPYIGCDYRSSAIAMDKVLTKIICSAAGIPVSPFLYYDVNDGKESKFAFCEKIKKELRYPLFVKPAHLGSAIGVMRTDDPDQLEAVIDEVLQFDRKIIVEEEIRGREIEFAVLGNGSPTVFPPGEVLASGKMYSYEAKYGDSGFATDSQAKCSPEQIELGKGLALSAYKSIGCEGMARVDFFLDQNGNFFLNEINPIPGFTAISLYPKICENNGLSFQKLLDKLIILALRRHRDRK